MHKFSDHSFVKHKENDFLSRFERDPPDTATSSG